MEVAVQLRQLQHFEAVHRMGSFTQAAREQFVSQSALSRSIQALEEELGQLLFDRTTHSVEPTDAAEALITHAIDAVSAARRLEETARMLRDGDGGSVAIGTGAYPARPLLSSVVESLSRTRPGLQVAVVGGAAADLIAALVRRELDVVVCDVSKAAESPSASDLETVPLPEEPLAAVVGAEHPLAGTDPSPAEVAAYPLVLPPPAPFGRRLLARSLGPDATPRLPFYEVSSTSSCLDVVADQRSVTFVPVSLARSECPARGLRFRVGRRDQVTHDGIHRLKARTPSTSARIAMEVIAERATALAEETARWRRAAGSGWKP